MGRMRGSMLLAVGLLFVAGCTKAPPKALIGTTWAERSAQMARPKFTFGVVADVQYADVDAHKFRRYRESADKLRRCVEVFNAERVDFVVHLGDMIDRDPHSYDTIMPIWHQLTMPTYSVIGNHDDGAMGADRAGLLKHLGISQPYYSFSRPGWRFIVLDTTGNRWAGTDTMRQAMKASHAINAAPWNGPVDPDQMLWLKSELAAAQTSGQRVIVFGHMPVFPPFEHNALNDAEIRKAFETSGVVVAYFCGHDHAGKYAVKKGIHYVNVAGMVEAYPTAYATICVYDDLLVEIGEGREPVRELRFSRRNASKAFTQKSPAPPTSTAPASQPAVR